MNTINRGNKYLILSFSNHHSSIDFMTEEEKLIVERDEEERKKTQTNYSKAHIMQRMRETATSVSGGHQQDLTGLNIDRRSRRVARESIESLQHRTLQTQESNAGRSQQKSMSHAS